MLKNTTILLSVILAASMLSVSCGSKKKNPDTQVGGVEGETLDPSVKSGPIGGDGFTPGGSDTNQIPGLSSVRFDYDSSTLSAEARKQLADNANWIKGRTGTSVQIEGHCDSRGSVEYNLALGERRAKAVKNYLVSLGVDSKRLSILSYGEERPIATGESEEAYAQNRRANFVPLSQ